MKKSLSSIITLFLCGLVFSQVGIGTPAPNTAAALDVSSTNKGALLPRVTLISSTDTTTIPAADAPNGILPAGLLVYNTGTDPNFASAGYFYWDGAKWMRFDESTSVSPVIDDALQCINASLSPATYTPGTLYTGTLSIPYTSGNGGRYNNGSKEAPINGLSYQLQGDKLSNGSGVLVYTVTGTPISKDPTTFPINFLGQTCDATVGTGVVIDFIKYARNSFLIDGETPTKSITKIGDLEVRYNGTNPAIAGHIEFRATRAANLSWLYHKAGTQAQNLEYYDSVVSVPNAWNRLARDVTAANINAPNRDIGVVTLTIQGSDIPVGSPGNTTGQPLRIEGQLYRITLQATNTILASTKNLYYIPGTAGSGTIFVEMLGDSTAK